MEKNRLERSFHKIFCETDDGRDVLNDLLEKLNYFSDDINDINPQGIIISNYILKMCDITTEKNRKGYIRAITQAQGERE